MKTKLAGMGGAPAQTFVDDVFSTYLYTGNASTQTITNGIDLAGKGGLVWIKDRTSANPHQLIDTSRGKSSSLASNSNTTPTTGTHISSFNSNGFSLSNHAYINAYGYNFASWTFRKALKFFDVVTYTGTGSARTIAHSLGVAPGMVIVKRTDAAGNWQVYSNGLTSATYFVSLDLIDAQASGSSIWDSTAPTSSVFSVGVNASVNASGGTYVAYLYAHDTSSTGIIQCGSYVGNGLTAGPNITLGWEPQYVLRKNASNARGGPDGNGSWDICDSMRGMSQTSCPFLLANSSAAEDTSTVTTGFIIPNATGFVDTYTYPGDTYIYMAIRMPNKPPTTGTQVYNAIARTGTGGAVTVSGAGFPPDVLLCGDRNTARGYAFADKLRGIKKTLLAPVVDAELSDITGISSFNMDGVSIVSIGDNGSYNVLTDTYINYFFKRAPGFFDEVCYTGTGVAATQAHNLGVVPEMIIVKARSVAGSNWGVYVSSLGNTQALLLNLTNVPAVASYIWNNTSPTSSVFTIGTAGGLNASGTTYVAYLFATLAGISKVGSYTGNGSTGQAIACGFSAGARFVLIKRTDSTGDWYTFDSARGLTSGSSPYLLLNSTAAETTGNNGVYASTGGFTLGATASTTTNINGASYIYLSVA